MAKLTAALLLVFVIELSLVYFSGTNYEQSSIYSFLMSPEAFSSTAFYAIMFGILALATTAIIVPGSFYQVNQWALFSVAAAAMITFGVSIAHLWAFINGQLVGLFNNISMGGFIATLIVAPLMIFYLVAIIEWTRQN